MTTNLFVIRQLGRNLYWTCSTEHGCGWHDNHPKQAFSPSELVKEIRRLIDEKWFTPIEVCQLSLSDAACDVKDKDVDKYDKSPCPMCGD